jgi:hypothetical protein
VTGKSKTLKLEPFWDEQFYLEWNQYIKNNDINCKEASSTLAMGACNAIEIEQAYQINYKYYQKAISAVSDAAADTLFESYEYAHNYMDSFCGSVSSNTTGTRRGSVAQNCFLVLIQANTVVLWDQFLTNRAGEAAYVDFPEPIPTHTNLYK